MAKDKNLPPEIEASSLQPMLDSLKRIEQLSVDLADITLNPPRGRFRTQFNHTHKPEGLVFKKPSLTRPGQAQSVDEIIQKYVSGYGAIGGLGRVPEYYGEDETFQDFASMDLADREELIRQKTEELQAIERKIARSKQLIRDKEVNAKLLKRLNAEKDAADKTNIREKSDGPARPGAGPAEGEKLP